MNAPLAAIFVTSFSPEARRCDPDHAVSLERQKNIRDKKCPVVMNNFDAICQPENATGLQIISLFERCFVS